MVRHPKHSATVPFKVMSRSFVSQRKGPSSMMESLSLWKETSLRSTVAHINGGSIDYILELVPQWKIGPTIKFTKSLLMATFRAVSKGGTVIVETTSLDTRQSQCP